MIVTARVEITYEVPDNLSGKYLWDSGLEFIDNGVFQTKSKKVVAVDLMPEEKETIFQDVIDIFGEKCQIRKAIEELLELATALSHYCDEHREENKNPLFQEDIRRAVASELADVMVITEQLKILFSDQDIEGEYNRKIERLRARIKNRNVMCVEKNRMLLVFRIE